jgi:DNA-binding response OmpR family regulator
MSKLRLRILVVEDDVGVRQALQRGLDRNGFDSIAVATTVEALRVDEHDVALVDLGLTDGDGVELCRELRSRFPERPIIVVTGRHDELDVIDALDAGADDYVTKPFSLAVLAARIRRHVDRSSPLTVVGALRIDRRGRRADLAGDPLDLTPREFDLLAALALRCGETMTKNELISSVWDTNWSKSTHTLAVHVGTLRSKLQRDDEASPTIVTVPRLGYRLDAVPSNR